MKNAFWVLGIFLIHCGQAPEDKCKQITIGSSPTGIIQTSDLPISVSDPTEIGDVEGPFVQLVCCEDPKVVGCNAQTYSCPAPAGNSFVFSDTGYDDGNGDMCMIWENNGTVIARAWIEVT